MTHKKSPRPWWGQKSVARKAMKNWSFSSAAKLSYVHFGENATRKVQNQGHSWALRVYRPNRWSVSQMKVEHRLMNFLGEQFGVGSPAQTVCGDTLAAVPLTNLQSALFPWAKGRLSYRKVTPTMVSRLGEYLGRMHSHLISQSTANVQKRWDNAALVFDQVDLARKVMKEIGFSDSSFSFLAEKAGELVGQWEAFAPLNALVHADLHLGNLKWTADRLHPIDFDDCGYAPLPYDLAIPASCFGRLKGYSVYLHLFLENYNKTGPREVCIDELRLFMAIRRVWLLGWVCDRQDIFSQKALKDRCAIFLNTLREYR